MSGPDFQPQSSNLSALSLAHVADFYKRYPGEVVTFYTRLEIHEPADDLSLRVWLPDGLALRDYLSPQPEHVPSLETWEEGCFLIWSLPELPAGAVLEYQTCATIARTEADTTLTTQASVVSAAGSLLVEESVSLLIRAKGKYLRYLPALYEQDDFIGRYLMLFESFWSPLDTQIGSLYNYFDPHLTPAYFLPWLAGWLSLELEEQWPEDRLRQLLHAALFLHHSRGTRRGLAKYLELYTGCEPEIIEACAENFALGEDAKLSPALALGSDNQPHTFTVVLRLPSLEAESPEKQNQLAELRRRAIEAIIERQKPAHLIHTLRLESL